ncbi:hypothetical protein Tco_0485152 [Tanacetum coccineum]
MTDIFNVPNYIGFKDLFAQMYSGSPTIQSDDSFPSSSSMKTSDSTTRGLFKIDTFKIISYTSFRYSMKVSNLATWNPLFEGKRIRNRGLCLFINPTLTSPEASELEAYLKKDSIPPGIDLTLPTTLEVSSSNHTSLTLTG